MRIIIVGAGEVGRHLCQQLSSENHDVVLIDNDPVRLHKVEREQNILAIEGNGASSSVLEEADIGKADLFIAVTDMDEVNLIACIMAGAYGSMRRVARVRNSDYLDPGSPFRDRYLGIDLVINPDQVMADEIIKISSMSAAFEVVNFFHGQVVIAGYPVTASSAICGIKLSELRELKGLYNFVVAAIVRENHTIIPRGEDRIELNDRIYVVTRSDDIKAVEEILNIKSPKLSRVFIIGGGEVGTRVARQMEAEGVDVLIVEENHKRCELLAEQLSSSVVLNFDGLDATELVNEGIDDADLLVAVTDSDTTNILASLLAKHHGAAKCITRISRADFIPLLGNLGIDVALSARLVAANMILKFVRRGIVLSAAGLIGSNAEVVEFVISKRWPYEGRALVDIPLPKGVNVVAIVRSREVLIPSGGSVLQTGDRVILFALKDAASRVGEFFSK
jgi:trk system potassium uptake protein TrkA